MWGIEFGAADGDGRASNKTDPLGPAVVAAALRNGLLVYPAGGSLPGSSANQILVGPPLTITDGEIAELGRLLRKSIADVFA